MSSTVSSTIDAVSGSIPGGFLTTALLHQGDVAPAAKGDATRAPKRKVGEALAAGASDPFTESSLSTLASSSSSTSPRAAGPGKKPRVSSPPPAILEEIRGLNKKIATAENEEIRQALNGFASLVERGFAYPEALELAIKVMKEEIGEGYYVREVCKLLEALIDKGQEVKEAIEVVGQRFLKNQPYTTVHYWAPAFILDFFTSIFKKGQGLEQVTEMVQLEMAQLGKAPRGAAPFTWVFLLWKEVVEAGHVPAYKPAMAAAVKNMKSEEIACRTASLRLFATVVRAGYLLAAKPAMAAARQSISSESYSERQSALDLVQTLLGEGVDDAIDVLIFAVEKHREKERLREISSFIVTLIDGQCDHRSALTLFMNTIKEKELNYQYFDTPFLLLTSPVADGSEDES